MIRTDAVARTIARVSQCICRTNNEVPCWSCDYDAFNVYWLARWEVQPVTDTVWWAADGHRETTWSVLCPSSALYPRTIRYRHLLRVPYEVKYFSGPDRWDVAGAQFTYIGTPSEPLEKLLRTHRKAIAVRDSQPIKGQKAWVL